MAILRFRIRFPTGQIEQINIEGERALIGTGAHCDIRIPLDQGKVEHVTVEVAPGDVVFARSLAFEPQPLINNVPFTQARLPPDAVLSVSQTQMYVELADTAAEGKVVAAKANKTSPVRLAAMVLLALGASAYFLFDDDDATQVAKKDAPALWGPPITTCSRQGISALALGQDRLSLADSKRERRPFHANDGVQAVPLYEEAAACLRAAGTPGAAEAAAQADEVAKYLRADVDNDYRGHRVRLEHCIRVEDPFTGLREARILLAYLDGKSGEYVTWLKTTERRLRTERDKAEKDKKK